MSILDDGKALWHHIVATAEEAPEIITSVITGIHEVHTGAAPNILASIKQRNPRVLDIIKIAAETVASEIGGPLAAGGIGFAIDLMAMSHAMTQEEQNAWMDRQNTLGG